MDRTLLQRWVDAVVASRFLIGDPEEPAQRVARRVRLMTFGVSMLSNLIGTGVVIAYALLVLTKPDDYDRDTGLTVNLGVAGVYVLLAFALGGWWGHRLVERGANGIATWLPKGLPPTEAQRDLVIRAPQRIMTVQIVLWGVATVLFLLLNIAFVDSRLGISIALTVLLGGITTSTASYLAAELALRPAMHLALTSGTPDRRGVPGVSARILLAWALGTAVPVLGLLFSAISALVPSLSPGTVSTEELALTALVLGGIGLLFGAVVMLLAAYATVHPLASMRRGLSRVGQGDLEVRLPVWDSTEIGELQGGFNEMVEGLRERELVRDLFGRQVGEEVAQHAIAGGVRLGGELRPVGVLFVDLVGSTALAARIDPEEVVALLNRFLAVVVEVVEECGGFVNKFEGDAALAIFGAPAPLEDAAGSALRAARTMHRRLVSEVPELTAAIGVAYGEAVAGHIGTERRYEYTVIGDPVNEAARLCELAKQQPELTLASGAAVTAGAPDERGSWRADGATVLRGRAQATQLHIPTP